MSKRYVLSEYVELAMRDAVYDKLEDATFSGGIPSCPGVFWYSVPQLKMMLREAGLVLGREISLKEWESL